VRLRTFIAASMAEAIEQVRRELGPDAIIVSDYANEAGGVEVTAAIETMRPGPAAQAPRPSRLPDIEASLEQLLRGRLREIPRDIAPDMTRSAASDARGHAHASAAPFSGASPSGIPFDETLIARALDRHGLPGELRDALVAAAAALDGDDAVVSLAAALETRFGFEPVPVLPQAPVMLIGLPGAGKTVTMAKLAAASIIEGLAADLITTDTSRAGALAQCDAYGQLLGLRVRDADGIDALSLLLEDNDETGDAPGGRRRPRFIDTTGINPFDGAEFAALRRLADGARLAAGAEPVLVLSASGDPAFLGEVAAAFTQTGARRLIITQLDISRRLGPVLAAADGAHLALAQVSVTPYLAHGLAPLNPAVCARLLIGAHEKQTGVLSRTATQ